MVPPIIDLVPSDQPPGWRTRVIPNKYPILAPVGTAPSDPPSAGYGYHEIIIETPRHNAGVPELSPEEMQAVVKTWHCRICAALERPDIEVVLLFGNRGNRAGASLGHLHSQLVALASTPPRLADALAWARSWHEEHGTCAVCEAVRREIANGGRVVELTEEFAVLVPFAAASPLEQWIVPREHMQSFTQADEASLATLGGVLQRAVRRLESAAGDPAYNMVVEPGSFDPGDAASAHWAMRIVPKLTTPGGFELLSGIAVNPSIPKEDAECLRGDSKASNRIWGAKAC
jgi:UDPglucose--hexose-1-phosphate uridylyltransferase